ncbi:GIY-YIG nuclease family protein [Fastidiosipila sanguinis]|uniref:Endonuclease n=1 Tax=Fastidiosipila sanguinis TaxID=236753 RepID=A0A2S0KPT8_9FIRM|nr:endonuclease [Fastidiosipila sanguinis]
MSRKVETEKDTNLENSEKNEPSYWVYILKCIDNTLYTGVARDPYKRLQAHNSGKGAKYTRNRRPCKLLYTEPQSNRSTAQSREYQIKQLTRAEKLDLIKLWQGNIDLS